MHLFFPFYPRKILWTGLAVIGAGMGMGLLFLLGLFWQSAFFCEYAPKEPSPLFPQKDLCIAFGPPDVFHLDSSPRIEGELAFSFAQMRPGSCDLPPDLAIQCKRSAQHRKISLPSRVDFCYIAGDMLGFSDEKSLFWTEFSSAASGKVSAVVWMETPSQGAVEVEQFLVSPQAYAIRQTSELAEGTPIRILAESRWLGQDVFFEKYSKMGSLYRIGKEDSQKEGVLAVGKNEWLVWKDGRWLKEAFPENRAVPIARVASADQKALVLECWELDNYFCISLPFVASPPLKIRSDELFHSVRIRSERQISCMLEKQCLILRCGDWVLKTDGKWKILKKAEEKDAYQKGTLAGELFVFEKIDSKQGQKWIQGTFFSVDKTQMAAIDMQAGWQTARSGKRRVQ